MRIKKWTDQVREMCQDVKWFETELERCLDARTSSVPAKVFLSGFAKISVTFVPTESILHN